LTSFPALLLSLLPLLESLSEFSDCNVELVLSFPASSDAESPLVYQNGMNILNQSNNLASKQPINQSINQSIQSEYRNTEIQKQINPSTGTGSGILHREVFGEGGKPEKPEKTQK